MDSELYLRCQSHVKALAMAPLKKTVRDKAAQLHLVQLRWTTAPKRLSRLLSEPNGRQEPPGTGVPRSPVVNFLPRKDV